MKQTIILLIFILIHGFSFAEKPNVVIILADDLGWKDLGCYGSDYYETPSVDRLAREGTRFTDAYAAHPVCGPSRAAIMSGKFAIRTGNVGVVGDLPAEEVTMAEAFKRNGYTTYFTGKWHLGMTEGRDPASQGFDYVVGVNHAGQPGSYFYPYKDIGQDWIGGKRRIIPERDVLGLKGGEPGEFLTDRLTDEAVDFIRKHKEEPFFLFFSHYAVHTPLQGKPEYIRHYEPKGNELFTRYVLREVDGLAYSRIRQSNPVYAANLQSLDESVGRVMETLSELGLEDRTMVVFTSDNGGFSTTKGGNTQIPTSNLPLRFGKGWMYEGGIRVPAIVKYPGIVEAGVESDLAICGYDLYPTVLSLAGLPLLPEQHEDGLAIFDPSKQPLFDDRIMIWYYPQEHISGHRPSGAVRRGDYKLILDLDAEADQYDHKVRLFNIEQDISETTDLAAARSVLSNSLRQELEALIKAYE